MLAVARRPEFHKGPTVRLGAEHERTHHVGLENDVREHDQQPDEDAYVSSSPECHGDLLPRATTSSQATFNHFQLTLQRL